MTDAAVVTTEAPSTPGPQKPPPAVPFPKVIEEETLRESANWPEGKEFRSLEPMNRITLNVILRTVFGADGVELDYLREIIPPWAKLGSRMATLPEPPVTFG